MAEGKKVGPPLAASRGSPQADALPADEVILVDALDHVIGTMEKMEAHRRGVLHRAFSVFVFDPAGRLILQQRAAEKYHSAGLWTNTCCSHPRPGEGTDAAAARRLREEMGFECPLEHKFAFTYRAAFGNGLIEHELDHVYFGRFAGEPTPDPREVGAVRRVALEDLAKEVAERPGEFTEWLKVCLPRVVAGRTPNAESPTSNTQQ